LEVGEQNILQALGESKLSDDHRGPWVKLVLAIA
jgi:hypothetical protein